VKGSYQEGLTFSAVADDSAAVRRHSDSEYEYEYEYEWE